MDSEAENAAAEVSAEKLVADLRTLVADTEELLRASAGQAGEKAAAARERIEASLARSRQRLLDAERALEDKAGQAARAVEEYVHENPWRALGIAAFAGFVLGALINRR
ncbi:MAG TPA: DUF883 family protein [Burkholderiales bacterium]|nr:DUF883 family protein [Burkholderiales bacterium]